jgi:hypothetical protein
MIEVINAKFDIHVFITITGSISLLVDYKSPNGIIPITGPISLLVDNKSPNGIIRPVISIPGH